MVRGDGHQVRELFELGIEVDPEPAQAGVEPQPVPGNERRSAARRAPGHEHGPVHALRTRMAGNSAPIARASSSSPRRFSRCSRVSYRLRARAAGFRPDTSDVFAVTVNAIVTVDVRLHPLPAPN
jgi:hypothetical protein